MNEETSVETTGATVEEAIAAGLAQLNAQPFEVIVDVLDEPSSGLFGMGARPARVRLSRITRSTSPASEATVISQPIVESVPVVLPTSISEEPPAEKDRREERRREEPRGEGRRRRNGRREGQGERRRDDRRSAPAEEDLPPYFDLEVEEGEDAGVPFLSDSVEVPENELDEEGQIAKVVLNELLERMSIRARIVVRRAEPDERGSGSPWILDVLGTEQSRLVGRRGETLAALQYITRLITSRELQKRSEVVVDVAGYKAKRARGLHNLALRMAVEAVERNRVVALEPMPPHERRIIHLALRGREDVTTKSIGEGAARKVTIVPRERAE